MPRRKHRSAVDLMTDNSPGNWFCREAPAGRGTWRCVAAPVNSRA